MKANLPPPEPRPNPPAAAPPVPPAPHAPARRLLTRRRAGLAVLLLALAGVGVGVWWWTKKPPPPEPPLPPDISDPEVRAAISKARKKLLAAPQAADAWGEYGTVLLAHLFDRDADSCFAEAARLDPDDPRWPYVRGRIALKPDPEKAVTLLGTAAEAARDKPAHRQVITLAFAEALLERGDTDRAAELFRQEVGPPVQARAVFGLGMVAMVRGDDATAAKHFEAARAHPSCRKQATAHLAVFARRRGDVPAAKQLEAEANALDDDPPWPDSVLDRGYALQVGARGFERRVAVLQRENRFREAADAYLAQARQTPRSKLLTGAAMNLLQLQDYAPAVALLREAVQLDPADANAHYSLALVLFVQAEQQWVKDPASAAAAAAFREVAATAKRVTELKPDHALAYLFWGLSLKNLGEPKAAIDPLRNGLAIRPGEFEMHLALGQVLAATGDRAGAEASLNTARQLQPDDPRPAQELAKLKPGG